MALAVFVLCFGLMLWRLSIASIIAYIVVTLFYIVIQRREEEALINKFGDGYCGYRQQVPALNMIRGLIRVITLKRGAPLFQMTVTNRDLNGRGERTRTSDLSVPNAAR